MTRPLMQLSVVELEGMVTASCPSAKLRQIRDELRLRKAPRAVALLATVEDALRNGSSASTGAPAESKPAVVAMRPQPDPPLSRTTMVPQVPTTTEFPKAQLGPMALEEAYRALGLARDIAWAAIEARRVQLVSESRPDRWMGKPPEQRVAALQKAQIANHAYLSIARSRDS